MGWGGEERWRQRWHRLALTLFYFSAGHTNPCGYPQGFTIASGLISYSYYLFLQLKLPHIPITEVQTVTVFPKTIKLHMFSIQAYHKNSKSVSHYKPGTALPPRNYRLQKTTILLPDALLDHACRSSYFVVAMFWFIYLFIFTKTDCCKWESE